MSFLSRTSSGSPSPKEWFIDFTRYLAQHWTNTSSQERSTTQCFFTLRYINSSRVNPSFIILSYEIFYTQTALFSNLKFPELPFKPKIQYVIYKITRLVYDSAFKKDLYVIKELKSSFLKFLLLCFLAGTSLQTLGNSERMQVSYSFKNKMKFRLCWLSPCYSVVPPQGDSLAGKLKENLLYFFFPYFSKTPDCCGIYQTSCFLYESLNSWHI